MNPISILAIAIVSEVFGSTMLKKSDGFTNLIPSLGVIIGFALAFYFLALSLKSIPLSLGYGIWAGAGTALTTLIGVIIWGEPFNIITFISLVAIILGVILLNSSSAPENEKEPSNV
ncbi:DMT family transporter [Priestia megaterium]|uniref:DMT family transporter n=1 Tax=Priestia megaterium TaxID=1404 RepID=UPI00159C1FF0|nr:multidrug efflux SMR transporter [Priestia megaterium]